MLDALASDDEALRQLMFGSDALQDLEYLDREFPSGE